MAVHITLRHFSGHPTDHPLVLPTPSVQRWDFTLLTGRVPEVCEVYDEKAIAKGQPGSTQQGMMWGEPQFRCESCPGLTRAADMEMAWWHETPQLPGQGKPCPPHRLNQMSIAQPVQSHACVWR